MLDPSQRALTTVQEYLTEQDQTAVGILKEAVQKYVGDLQPRQADLGNSEEKVDTTPWNEGRQNMICS